MIRLNTLTHPSQWLQLDAAAEEALAEFEPWSLDEQAALDRYTVDHDLDVVGVDVVDIGIDDALTIADQYGGGEFDDEVAGIVLAMCTLRDHVRALAARVADRARWEAEANTVLAQWREVADEIERLEPCPLGHSYPEHARRVVAALIDDHEMRHAPPLTQPAEVGIDFGGPTGYVTPWPAGRAHAESVVAANPDAELVELDGGPVPTGPFVFEVGGTYVCHSPANADSRWWFTIVSRTARFVTIREVNALIPDVDKRVGVHETGDGVEFVYPLGRYSMCPVLRANRVDS